MKYDIAAVALVCVCVLGIAWAVGSITNNQAREVRLVGWCNGKLLAAMEEDQFPHKGCDWIEAVNLQYN